MHSKIILALAATATATVLPRETGASSQCLQDAQSVLESVPLPTGALIGDLAKASGDPCNYTPAPSVSAEFSSYVDEIKSWASDHESALSKIEAECPTAAPMGNLQQCFSKQGGSGGDDSKSSDGGNDKKSAASTAQVAGGAILGAALVAVLAL